LLRKRASLALKRFLIAFCIGVAATLAWQSYGDAAREMIANSYPQLGWLAPQAEPVAQNAPETIGLAPPAAPFFDPQQLNAMSVDLDAPRQSIDRIVSSIAAIQEQMLRSADRTAHSVAQLTAGQEQMTREITKLQAIEQYVLYRNTESPPRPAPAPVHPRFCGLRRHADGQIRRRYRGHCLGCIEASRALPRISGGMSPPRGVSFSTQMQDDYYQMAEHYSTLAEAEERLAAPSA
jgi:hypothetical protein